MQSTVREQAVVYQVDSALPPVLRVKPGEPFLVQTNDHMNQLLLNKLLQSGKKHIAFAREDFPPIFTTPMTANPVIGPIYVEGAEDGDLLAVHIEDIVPVDQGSCCVLENMGVVANRIGWEEVQGNQAWLFDLLPGPGGTTSDGYAVFEESGKRWKWRLNPHIGTILTCPSKGRGVPETLTTQGAWGGNVDVRDVCRGHTVYLNCFNDGGLLFLGDVHAAQGDSELTGAAIEAGADVTLRVDVVKRERIPGVMRIETPRSIIQVDSNIHAGTYQNALNACFLGMMDWLVKRYGFSKSAAYVQMSTNSNVRINVYQFIDSFFVCGVEFGRDSLSPSPF